MKLIKQTKKGEQRYLIGIVLNDSLSINKPLEDHLIQNGFKCVWLNAIDEAVVIDYPINSKFSIWIACLRVYPKLANYIKVNI